CRPSSRGHAIRPDRPRPPVVSDTIGVDACTEAACLRHRPYPPEAGALCYYTSASFRRIMQAGETSATDLRVTARLRETDAMADETVLVVDDEVGMVTLLRNYLTREGYEIHTAPSGETALQLLEEHDCDVVLTDLRMGGMDGLALVRAIHATR